MPDQPPAKNLSTEGKEGSCTCGQHGIIEELRVYVYKHVPVLDTRVGRIWATLTAVTLCGGVVVTLLMTTVNTTRAEVRAEQVTHKKETSAQLSAIGDSVKAIAKSAKAQERSAAITERNVAVFMERYSVLQEQNRREIEELNRRTERNHEEIERLNRGQDVHQPTPTETIPAEVDSIY